MGVPGRRKRDNGRREVTLFAVVVDSGRGARLSDHDWRVCLA